MISCNCHPSFALLLRTSVLFIMKQCNSLSNDPHPSNNNQASPNPTCTADIRGWEFGMGRYACVRASPPSQLSNESELYHQSESRLTQSRCQPQSQIPSSGGRRRFFNFCESWYQQWVQLDYQHLFTFHQLFLPTVRSCVKKLKKYDCINITPNTMETMTPNAICQQSVYLARECGTMIYSHTSITNTLLNQNPDERIIKSNQAYIETVVVVGVCKTIGLY